MPVVAALPIFLIALLGIIILYSYQKFADTLVRFLHALPFIGKYVANLALDVLGVVYDLLFWTFGPSIGAFKSMVVAPVTSATTWLLVHFQAIENFFGKVNYLFKTLLPALVARVERYAHDLYLTARSYALSLYHSAQAYAHSLVVTARAYALSLYHRVQSYAHALYLDARAYSLALYHDATAYALKEARAAETLAKTYAAALVKPITAELSVLEKSIKSELSTAEAYTTSAVSQAMKTVTSTAAATAGVLVTDLEQEIVAPIAAAWPAVDGYVGALQDVIATDLPDLGALVRAIPRAVPTDLAAAIPAVLALSIPAIKFMEECGVPNCRNLSKFGRDLQDLFKLFEGATFLEFLIDAITDPGGTAHEMNGFVTPIAGELTDAFRGLVGV